MPFLRLFSFCLSVLSYSDLFSFSYFVTIRCLFVSNERQKGVQMGGEVGGNCEEQREEGGGNIITMCRMEKFFNKRKEVKVGKERNHLIWGS